MMYFIAVDVVEWATKAGSLPMQVLLLIGLIILGLAIRFMHKDNQKTTQEFISKMDAKEIAITVERKERIAMLMQLMKEDIDTKKDLAHAVQNNTNAVGDLKEFIKDQTDVIRELCKGKIRR